MTTFLETVQCSPTDETLPCLWNYVHVALDADKLELFCWTVSTTFTHNWLKFVLILNTSQLLLL